MATVARYGAALLVILGIGACGAETDDADTDEELDDVATAEQAASRGCGPGNPEGRTRCDFRSGGVHGGSYNAVLVCRNGRWERKAVCGRSARCVDPPNKPASCR